MSDKLILNISDAPTYMKIIPVVAGIAAGAYVYKMKKCMGCATGAGLLAAIIFSTPLLASAKNKGAEIKP